MVYVFLGNLTKKTLIRMNRIRKTVKGFTATDRDGVWSISDYLRFIIWYTTMGNKRMILGFVIEGTSLFLDYPRDLLNHMRKLSGWFFTYE